MKDLSMTMVAGGLGILLAISFGLFLVVVLGLHAAAVIATGGAFVLVFALGVYAGAHSAGAADHIKHGLVNRAG
jgi:hypothetical protein